MLQQLKNALLAAGFNECILLFSDLPDIVMETCVASTQRMYTGTPPSVAYRKHVLHDREPGEFDIEDQRLDELQAEQCPRISASDVLQLVRDRPDGIAVVDLRSASEFRRAHLAHSVNVPFGAVQMEAAAAAAAAGGDALEECCAEVPDLRERLAGRLVVVMSAVHGDAVQVSEERWSECGQNVQHCLWFLWCGVHAVQQVPGRLRRVAGVHLAQGLQHSVVGGAQHSGDDGVNAYCIGQMSTQQRLASRAYVFRTFAGNIQYQNSRARFCVVFVWCVGDCSVWDYGVCVYLSINAFAHRPPRPRPPVGPPCHGPPRPPSPRPAPPGPPPRPPPPPGGPPRPRPLVAADNQAISINKQTPQITKYI